MRIHVGTSGYNYPEWKGSFYPAGLKAKEMFAFYASRFDTVEINFTFYRMPTVQMASGWRDQAPEGFIYVLKAPRRITHDRRLKDCDEFVDLFAEAARALGPHLGPLLFQLPPSARCDLPRLEAFLALIPPDLRVAFEFRHESWLNDDVFDALEKRGAALCVADLGDRTTPVKATATFGYFRLRDEGYRQQDLRGWVDRVAEHTESWQDVFVYFKHEDEGRGPEFAAAFIEELRRAGLIPS
jgi:uncharacterized protein YecE (DUF72 family)